MVPSTNSHDSSHRTRGRRTLSLSTPFSSVFERSLLPTVQHTRRPKHTRRRDRARPPPLCHLKRTLHTTRRSLRSFFLYGVLSLAAIPPPTPPFPSIRVPSLPPWPASPAARGHAMTKMRLVAPPAALARTPSPSVPDLSRPRNMQARSEPALRACAPRLSLGSEHKPESLSLCPYPVPRA